MSHAPQLVRDEQIDTTLDALADWRRRLVLATLAEQTPMQLDELATRVAATTDGVPASAVDSDDRVETMAELHHHHLPHLDATGLVTYDPDRRTVERSAHSIRDTLQPLVEQLDSLDSGR